MFWLELIASVILVFVVESGETWEIWDLFGIIIGGPLIAYFSSLLLYAFGELVDGNTGIQRSNNTVSKASEKSKEAAPAPIRKKPVASANPNCIKCPVCGREQNKLRKTCWGCGLEFETDEL